MDKNTALRELSKSRLTVKEQQRELDVFRRIAENQHEENEDLLKQLHAAWKEKDSCEAFLAAILDKCGEIIIPKEAVGEALKSLRVVVKVDEEAQTYALKVVNTDGKEGND